MDESDKRLAISFGVLIAASLVVIAGAILLVTWSHEDVSEKTISLCMDSCEVLSLDYYTAEGRKCYCVGRDGIPAQIPLKNR